MEGWEDSQGRGGVLSDNGFKMLAGVEASGLVSCQGRFWNFEKPLQSSDEAGSDLFYQAEG